MYHEILDRIEIRNTTFVKGTIIVEGDFPPHEFAPWIMAGKVKRHEGQPPAQPGVVPVLIAPPVTQPVPMPVAEPVVVATPAAVHTVEKKPAQP